MEGRRNGEGTCYLGNYPTYYTGTWKNGLRNGKVHEDNGKVHGACGKMGTGMGRCMGLVGRWELEWDVRMY